jgi:putative holliday junction resolvase
VRALGVDLGRSRTGLALSDPAGITCRPLEVLAERDQRRLIARILQAAEAQAAGEIVVGLPRPLAGGTNRQMDEAIAFARELERESSVPVVLWDERFTSKLAEQDRQRGEPRDAVAACYMLQNYLDSQNGRRGSVN